MLKSGYTYRNIYDILSDSKRISVSYYHFCALLKKYNLKKINITSILSKKYKESLENKLKSLPEYEAEHRHCHRCCIIFHCCLIDFGTVKTAYKQELSFLVV